MKYIKANVVGINLRELRINMFKLVNGSKQNGTVIRSDICIYCDNIKDHDECTNCDGFLDICFSYDKG